MVILTSHIDRFCQQYGLNKLKPDDLFEHFANYSVASNFIRNYTLSSDLLDDIHVGAGGDWGLDGILVLINGKPITDLAEAKTILDSSPEFNSRVVFIQAKNQDTIDTGDLAKTLTGAENMLRYATGAEGIFPNANEDIKKYREILKEIYRHSADAHGAFPSMHVYYVYKGAYKETPDFVSMIENHSQRIEDYQCLKGFQCKIEDRRTIVKLYNSGSVRPSVKITFEHKIPLPQVNDIESGYLCLIPMSEFRKLIIDDSGNFREEVFYDNVRAFQGDNTVNTAIDRTIKQGDINLFTALNNGLTIIAKEVVTVMKDMTITDYQVVNGCQTCHVIFNNITQKDINNLQLSVKVIASKNKDIRDRIIVANNSQTAVVREQLLSLLDEQRRIEDYYNAQQNFDRLYYERRSKQYQQDSNVRSWQVVSISAQITSFIAMILGRPGKIRGYFGQVLDNFTQDGIKVFDSKYNPALYFLSAYAYVQMTHLFATKQLPESYKKIKFHLLYAFRLMSEPHPLKQFNDKNVDKYCEHICKILHDRQNCNDAFNGAATLIANHVLKREPEDADRFSEDLSKNIKAIITQLNNINQQKKKTGT